MKEILLIKTSESEKIRNILNREHIDYQIIYDDILQDKDLTEEEIYRRDMRLANQDPERQKEIKFWDKIQATMMNEIEIKPRFGEVYKCAFYDETIGTEIREPRPVVVDNKEGKVMTDQIHNIDKQRLKEKIGELSTEQMAEIIKQLRMLINLFPDKIKAKL
ncbi:13538_t:CDS:2 [Gigaspora margarita]|uniref:13538_t:CDS:1 n=1 Tax=Gigaspora margarita TaxID=4874 RepID=A0ABM8VZZ7_GIGMA|nr:13538_t:CDS:2 [Gigaspora margarita]